MRVLAAAVLACLLLAGCGEGKPAAPQAFDGDAAHAFVAGLVTDAQGAPRHRVPGTPGHAAAAAWLWEQLQVPGWEAHWQNFTGADYVPLDKGSSSTYFDGASCSADEKARLATLPFHNLYAVHDVPDADRLVLLGAHWESKRFANHDDDLARRQDAVLGANDGASGVGVLLQLIRHVTEQDVDLPFDLGVVLFDGEDGFEDCHPLAGSLYFVHHLDTTGLEVGRFWLLDMVGDPDARFVHEAHSAACDPAFADLVQARGEAGPLASNFPGTRKAVSDDHLPFIEAGIPAIDLIDYGRADTRFGFPPYWHTTHDTLDKVQAAMLGHVGGLVLGVLADPGFVAAWPDACA